MRADAVQKPESDRPSLPHEVRHEHGRESQIHRKERRGKIPETAGCEI